MGKRRNIYGILSLTLATIAACEEQQTATITPQEDGTELLFVRGYRSVSDPCKLTGESALAVQTGKPCQGRTVASVQQDGVGLESIV